MNNETTVPEATADPTGRAMSDLLAANELRLKTNLLIAAPTVLMLYALAAFNAIHWTMWLPGAIAGTGLVMSLGMQLNRINDLRGS